MVQCHTESEADEDYRGDGLHVCGREVVEYGKRKYPQGDKYNGKANNFVMEGI